MRSYWLPFLLPEELEAVDGPPVRVRLLGEDLIAFRDSTGRIGLVDAYCPHRRVDLFFGRNEECGLRCIYHGWKFDIDGNCVDMPAEPANSPLRDEVKIKSYPVMEWGGLIWTYMGDKDKAPPRPPEIEWGLVKPSQRNIQKRLQESNWAQALEGGIDSSHVGILHSIVKPPEEGGGFGERQVSAVPGVPYLASDRAPRFFVRNSDCGMTIGARRHASENEYYWRITQYLAPFYTMISRKGDTGPISGHAWVPIDDEKTWTFTMYWDPDSDLPDEETFDALGVNVPVIPDGSYRPIHGRHDNYGIDRDMQRNCNTSGIVGIGLQDQALQETMGAIVDRSKEILGSGDTAIVFFRKLMLDQVSQVEAGADLSLPQKPEAYRVRSAGLVLPKDVDFVVGARESMMVR
ncbi:Rieske 2Fe-2S domain-containing protein [Novosphingobium aerophilum]|nr:Rieske 2Fe-2S domain-containing protein [Novosphingobium aerophilum]